MKMQSLEEEYNQIKGKLELFGAALKEQFESVLSEANVDLGFPLQLRIKKWESIDEKLQSKRFTVKSSLKELQDLLGMRIIVLSLDDIAKI